MEKACASGVAGVSALEGAAAAALVPAVLAAAAAISSFRARGENVAGRCGVAGGGVARIAEGDRGEAVPRIAEGDRGDDPELLRGLAGHVRNIIGPNSSPSSALAASAIAEAAAADAS
jgi:hypothetical protein